MSKIQVVNNQPKMDGRGHGFYDVFPDADMPGQINISMLQPGIVRGFHWHKNQTDYVFCPQGNMHVILVPTTIGYDSNFSSWDIEHYYIGEKNPQTLIIPPNTLHGYKSLYGEPATMVYYADKMYDPSDEHRCEWDFFGEEIWQAKNG